MVIDIKLSCYFFFLISVLSSVAIPLVDSESDPIGELVSLRSASDSGVIRLNDDGVYRFVTSVSTPRPYSFSSSSTPLISTARAGSASRSFFSARSIPRSQRLRSTALPSNPYRTYASWMENLQDESGKMEDGHYDGLESMADFVERRTKLTVGPIHRPPLLSKTQIIIIIALIVSSTPIVINKVLKGETYDYIVTKLIRTLTKLSVLRFLVFLKTPILL